MEANNSHKPASSPLLFGSDNTPALVAVEPGTHDTVQLFFRTGSAVQAVAHPFTPWLLLTQPPPSRFPACTLHELEGAGYCLKAEFASLTHLNKARQILRDLDVLHLAFSSPARMYLTQTGKTLFKGLQFADLVRMQFDLETCGLDPAQPDARILLIAAADTRGFCEVLEGDEKQILQRFTELVQQHDPDVLEGHNLFGFDFPYLIERARRCGIKLALGRDASEPEQMLRRSYAIGGSTRPFQPVHVYGRHVLDTYLLVQRFDWAQGALSSYGLKECARVFGFAAEDRVELPRDQMESLYQSQPQLVCTYAQQDVMETQQLANLVSPVEFYQTQMAPDNYGMVAVTGAGEKINSLFIRAYLSQNHSIPLRQPSSVNAGGYTDIRIQGLIENVVKADVESLYPSLMLTHRIAPANDTLGVFLPCLAELTARRIAAKSQAAAARESSSKNYAYYEGLQASFKVLINSFYGYLGGPFPFNDPEAAGRVTALGRSLVQQIAQKLEDEGCRVIEIDTDGVYFSPPPGMQGEQHEREMVERAGTVLPESIRLAFDGRYRRMLSLKTKNYVLETWSGRRILRGSSLRSRADEKFGRDFLANAISLLMEGNTAQLHSLYTETMQQLLSGGFAAQELARRERVTAKTFSSSQKRRNAHAAEGVPIGDFVQVYERRDGSLGRLEEYAQDEDRAYYAGKLYKFACRLESAFESQAEFQKCFPKPSRQMAQGNTQQTLDLFEAEEE